MDFNETIKVLMKHRLEVVARSYGVEGTEDVLKRVYKYTPELLESYLAVFYEMYPFIKKGGNNE